jgi:hypothetical protein
MGVIVNRIITMTTGIVNSHKNNVTTLDPEEKDIVKDVADVDEYHFNVVLKLTKGHPMYGQSDRLIASELTGLICLGMLSHPSWANDTAKADIETILYKVKYETGQRV